MNRAEAKNLVSSIQYLSAVTESTFLNAIDDGIPEAQRLACARMELEHSSEVILRILERLHLVDPDFDGIRQEVEREALDRGRKWMNERAEKISLLRLAGDDTPEELIP